MDTPHVRLRVRMRGSSDKRERSGRTKRVIYKFEYGTRTNTLARLQKTHGWWTVFFGHSGHILCPALVGGDTVLAIPFLYRIQIVCLFSCARTCECVEQRHSGGECSFRDIINHVRTTLYVQHIQSWINIMELVVLQITPWNISFVSFLVAETQLLIDFQNIVFSRKSCFSILNMIST